jgi:hypothetical protein
MIIKLSRKSNLPDWNLPTLVNVDNIVHVLRSNLIDKGCTIVCVRDVVHVHESIEEIEEIINSKQNDPR